MRFGVLGTGMVGKAVSARLAEIGHDVTIGTRDPSSPQLAAWADGLTDVEQPVRVATFADAARHAEVIVNATGGAVTFDVLAAVGKEALAGKVLLDISNPIDPDSGFPPTLLVANTDSLGEQIQRTYPAARVVKTLNTVTADVMVHPDTVPGEHVVFVCGEDDEAKATAVAMLREFGWPADRILDLGGIQSARATEMYLALWLQLHSVVGGHCFNITLARAEAGDAIS